MDYPFHPLAAAYPLLEGADFEAFKSSVQEHGLEKPIYLWHDQIIDGRNRYRACKEAGVPPEFYDVSETPAEKLPELLRVLNEDRRHLSVQFLKAQRAERIKRVAELNRQRQTTRDIAAAEGISQAQVRRDLEAAESVEPGGSTENPEPEPSETSTIPAEQPAPQTTAPPTVTGKDGKQYPARKAGGGKKGGKSGGDSNGKAAGKTTGQSAAKGKGGKKASPAANGTPEAEHPAAPAPPPPVDFSLEFPELDVFQEEAPDKDPLGLPLSDPMKEVFAARHMARELQNLLRRAARLSDALAKHAGGRAYRVTLSHQPLKGKSRFVSPHLKAALTDLKFQLPYCSVCPDCNYHHPGTFSRTCKACHGDGWITHQAWTSTGQEDRDRVLSLLPAPVSEEG